MDLEYQFILHQNLTMLTNDGRGLCGIGPNRPTAHVTLQFKLFTSYLVNCYDGQHSCNIK